MLLPVNPLMAAGMQQRPTVSPIFIASQEALARWCGEQKLEPQTRFHWSQVLLFNPNHAEAMKALGYLDR